MELSRAKEQKKIGISEERLREIIPPMRDYISFWREYPDMFVDFMCTGWNNERESTFRLFSYQRIFLRIVMRYKYVYAVFPRAYSKSFLSVLALLIRAILYPRAQLFSTAGGKEQASQILQDKITDICQKIPAFAREIDWRRGRTKVGKDSCIYVLKNGSTIENLAARESSRGRRMHAGLIEECVGVDQNILQQVIIPTMNVSRRCMDGTVQEDEVLNQSQIYITTAGYKNSFSYRKLIQLLVRMIVEPEKAFIMGGTWRIPVLLGLQNRNFINDLKKDETFNEASFEREYESVWTGTIDNAFFNGETFDHNRILHKSEYEWTPSKSTNQAYYILGVDVGRRGCSTVICVVKVTPQSAGPPVKSLVNIYDLNDEHFEDQAINIKKLYYKYKARRVVLDANGIGIGLLDYLIKTQTDESGYTYPDFGVYNDDEGFYKKFKTNNCEVDAIYALKANAALNTEAHTALQASLVTGKIKFLIDDRQAKTKLLSTKVGASMTPEQRNEYLKPFVLTTALKEELMNLREENEGINIILKQANKNIKKDKFSALEYAVYYIKQEEERRNKRKRFSAKDFMFKT